MKLRISEARLNDFVYMTLKKAFFEPAFNGANPRECDIRVCMNMIVPATNRQGFMASILRSDEKAPSSHTDFYEVETVNIVNECLAYLEGHWMKMAYDDENAFGPGATESFTKFFNEAIITSVMTVPEEQCGV